MAANLVPLLVALLSLLSAGMLLAAALFFIRRYRRTRRDLETGQNSRNIRQLTITAIPFRDNRRSQMYSEKQALMDNSLPMPLTPDSIPEIRITFPEEEDAQGRRKSGRVVIVQVGEAGVGFVRPVPEDLPPYQQHDGFSSVDLDKVGGLKEKERTQWV